ncbi:MAG: RNA 2',3'-cyclic phosphodiesterase [Planctomycetia bacterium]|nr:RNA 2',3'-cyclic phosphodiesterase [Planctomycetia bacterium]
MDIRIRTFVGLEVCDKSRAQAAALAQKLAANCGGVKWEPEHKYHLTLKFLDEIPNEEVHDICSLVQSAVRDFPSFVFNLQGAGAFPSVEHPRNVWLQVREGRENVCELAQKIDLAMQNIGFPRELRPFSPHVTLGRVRSRNAETENLSQLLKQYDAFDAGKTLATRVVVWASHMARSGTSYTILATAPLARKTP